MHLDLTDEDAAALIILRAILAKLRPEKEN